VRPLIEVTGAAIATPGGRPLFEGLDLSLSRERVAMIGRNGVGKSTLLAVLAGEAEPRTGTVRTASRPHFVPQTLGPQASALSSGELRKLALAEAHDSGSEILLLDEPTEDLDQAAVQWLRSWIRAFPGCVVVASHDRRLLEDFRHFFVASESGCRYFSGTLAELDAELEREHRNAQERYLRNLNRLAEQEQHSAHVARRNARKKRYGRCSELDRATPRIRLNQKRNQAQVSHGRAAKVREARLDAVRQWSKAARRALGVSFSVDIPAPALPEFLPDSILLRDVSARVDERWLFRALDLRVGRERIGLVGPNGSGKTTLLQVMLGRRAPTTGSVSSEPSRLGVIEQGGANWMLDESLLERLSRETRSQTLTEAAQLLVAHRFPLALAERPLRSLSPGERARAALICLFRRPPAPQILLLDEPTFSLDLIGQSALTNALRSWPGGLVVASHDRAFLSAIGVDTLISLGS
jgi:ATPase subunit of ABC transporter with duplicated ATPase domains